MSRKHLVNMRMSADEFRRLHRVADHYGLNVSSVLRFLLKREEEEIGLRVKLQKLGGKRRSV